MIKILAVCVLAAMLAVPVVASAASEVPAGFIALAPGKMNWKDAKAYCASKGGKLPLINGINGYKRLLRDPAPKGTPIEGFGTKGAKWPSSLPYALYWTATKPSDHPDLVWLVGFGGEGVNSNGVFDASRVYVDGFFGASQSNNKIRVVCVP